MLVDGIGPAGWARSRTAPRSGVHDGAVHVGERAGRRRAASVDAATWRGDGQAARRAWRASCETFTHNSHRVPPPRAGPAAARAGAAHDPPPAIAGRPVVVVAGPPRAPRPRRKALRGFLREQQPGADRRRRGGRRAAGGRLPARHRGASAAATTAERPSAKARRRGPGRRCASSNRGGDRSATETLERLGVRPLRLETARHARGRRADAGRRGDGGLGDRGGRHARDLPGGVPRPPAVRAGQHLPDPAQGRAPARRRGRRTHPLLRQGPPPAPVAGVAGLVLAVAAVATTPVGHEWAQDAWTWLGDLAADLRGRLP